jgi:hypothetical protein
MARVPAPAILECHTSGILLAYDPDVAFPFPAGVSGLVDPDDEPIMAILEQCAADRLRLGLPTYSRADLERLFQVLDAPAPRSELPVNVIRFPAGRRPAPSRRRR